MNETTAARVAAWHRLVAAKAVAPDRFAAAADSQLAGLDDATRETLLELVDAEPGADGGPVSRTDGTFNYIAAAVAEQTGVTGTEWLHRAFFHRLLEIWARNPDFSRTLRTAARTAGYREAAAEFDRWLDGPMTSDPDRRPLLARQSNPADAITHDAWCDLLAGVPRPSHIPPPTARALPRERLTAADVDHTAFSQTVEAWAGGALRADPGLDLPVAARLDVARDLWQRRRFAKVQMLEFGWPELTARATTAGGPKWLRLLESAVCGTADEAELPEAWRTLQADQRLVEFVRIRPAVQRDLRRRLRPGLGNRRCAVLPTGPERPVAVVHRRRSSQ
ncbi:hypothetical protein [Dactylosporangium sp. CA-092794]|uniref:hypothetical protein n=1 Tax=Dactylosporangium sp. CA-092794 TaxID=3239929 RepID=UPI003D8A5438